jgi:hypothetical protein
MSIPRANPRYFLMTKFPALWEERNQTIKIMSSRLYESKDNATYLDNWWFAPSIDDIGRYEFVLFAGAKDYQNRDFQLIKVPTAFLQKNLSNIDNSANGEMINLYIKCSNFTDARHHRHISFKEFCIN